MPSTSVVSFDRDVEDAPLDQLRAHPANPRQGDVGAIARSVERFGWYQPIVVQRSTGHVLAGNHRFLAAKALGHDTIPVVYVDVDDVTARAILVADNRLSDLATYDEHALADLLRELAVAEQLDGTGYDGDDLDALLADLARDDASSDDESGGPAVERYPLFGRELIIEEAFTWARDVGLDALIDAITPSLPECRRQLNALHVLDDEQLVNTKVAQRVPERWQRHRWDVPVANKSKRTLRQVFDTDEYLKHGIGLALDDGKPLKPSDLLSTLGFTRGGQVAANFRPGFALLMLRRYARPGARVLDTSAGFGGRLVGFLASSCSEYVGIDPASLTQSGNRAMADALALPDKRVELIVQPAEDVDVADLGPASFDVALTSPPYFAKEHYSDEPTQSFARYPEPERWRDGFLRPMLALQAAALKSGATSVVNIADVTITERDTIPLVDWTIDAAQLAGLEHVDTDRFPLMRVPGQGEQSDRWEPVLIFRKP